MLTTHLRDSRWRSTWCCWLVPLSGVAVKPQKLAGYAGGQVADWSFWMFSPADKANLPRLDVLPRFSAHNCFFLISIEMLIADPLTVILLARRVQ